MGNSLTLSYVSHNVRYQCFVTLEKADDYNKTILQTQQGSCTFELAVVTAPGPRLAQTQSRQKSQHGMRKGHELPHLAEEPLATGSYWERESQFVSSI